MATVDGQWEVLHAHVYGYVQSGERRENECNRSEPHNEKLVSGI